MSRTRNGSLSERGALAGSSATGGGRGLMGKRSSFSRTFLRTASARSTPRTSASRIRYWSTSASSDSTAAAVVASCMTRIDSPGVSHWKQARSSPASLASAIARFLGVWYCSQFLAWAKARSSPARSRRLSPAVWVLLTGGRRKRGDAEPCQHVLGFFVDGVDDTAQQPAGEQDLVGVADQCVEVVSLADGGVAAGGGARFPVVFAP